MPTNAVPIEPAAIPSTQEARETIRHAVADYCARRRLVPPLVLDEIAAHAAEVLASAGIDPAFRNWVAVLIGNESWRETLARVPFDRRILMLPKCLRSSAACKAESDALGLLCEACGRCSLGDIQQEAEALGYGVVIAEGTTAVAALLAQGGADAVLGVSCLEGLERSFGALTAYAVPGMAVPLLSDGCADTSVDLAWLRETLRLRTDAPPLRRIDLRARQREIGAWFEPEALRATLHATGGRTEALAREWLAQGGKRWRPLLCAGVYEALAEPGAELPPPVRDLAVAVECFHKASLAHDDIEDADDVRYDAPTLHRQHGVPVAINAGDLLIGEGYRLIAGAGLSPEQTHQMLRVAADGHCRLCQGQGEELLLRLDPAVSPGVAKTIEIFRQKTAPAFDVALQLGAIAADADAETRTALSAFSDALGVAYQIRDDLEDLAADHASAAGARMRPSLALALAEEEWAARPAGVPPPSGDWNARIRATAAEARARAWLARTRDETYRALRPLRQPALKGLLFRLTTRLLNPADAP